MTLQAFLSMKPGHHSKKKYAGIGQNNKIISTSYLAIITSNSKEDIVKLII